MNLREQANRLRQLPLIRVALSDKECPPRILIEHVMKAFSVKQRRAQQLIEEARDKGLVERV
jgi:cysteine synthase